MSPGRLSRVRASGIVRAVAGPPVRRLRREIQWRRAADFGVRREPAEMFPCVVARHRTPLLRPLAGLDLQLQLNKVVNLRLAAERLDGVVLAPGVRLSFWKEVGRPSRRRGFVEGMVLNHGRIEAGVGGGLCQLSNLLYWMTLHTPLSIEERWRHSYDVFPDARRTQPFGSGATCAWPAIDLQIENRTTAPYRLSVTVTDSHLVGEWRSTEPLEVRYRIEERNHRMTHESAGLYMRHNELWRVELAGGDEPVREELVAVNSAFMMYAPFLPAASAETHAPGEAGG